MRFENDGVGLNVLVDGPHDGVPVVFLHGVAASTKSYDWLPPPSTPLVSSTASYGGLPPAGAVL